METVIAFVLSGYTLWLLWLWTKIQRQDADTAVHGAAPSATILIAFRNERQHLPTLLSRLLRADATASILAVDDNSTDGTAALIQAAYAPDSRLRCIPNAQLPGKRGALATGVEAAQTELILQTDADCHPSPSWVTQAVQAASQSKADLTLFPLRFSSHQISPFWLSVINTEFASVMAVTCGMARAGKPVMCNGANLAHRKRLWQAAAPHLASQTHAGGDDMFLLDYAVTHRHPVAYHDAPGVWVETEAPPTLTAFLRQRRRWAAKWSAYKSPWPYVVVAISLFGQLAFPAAILLCMIGQGSGLLLTLIGSKLVIEAGLLRRQLQKGGMAFSLPAFLFWQVAYLPYILATTLPSLWRRRPVSWKT